MTHDEASLLLLLHGHGVTTDASGQQVALDDGFVGSLRPYVGLREENFRAVMEALLTVGEVLHRAGEVDRDMVHALWSMCATARAWGLHPRGMLPRNGLITAADRARLERWIATIEDTALHLLAGVPPHRLVYRYAGYVTAYGASGNVGFFVALMGRALDDATVDDTVEMLADALGALGAAAGAALPALRECERRDFTWYAPEERCTAETRGHLQRAIDAIERAGGVA